MFKLNHDKFNPMARANSVIQGDKYRITVLSKNLLRFEYQEDGNFQDEVTTMVINRDFPEVEFKTYRKDGLLYVDTGDLLLSYDEEEPTAYGLQIRVLSSAVNWNYGKQEDGNLGGTARTLDTIDGAVDVGRGVISRSGYVVIDDANSAMIDGDGWFQASDNARVDLYFFGHGRDYQGAIDDFYRLSGPTPLLPRFVFGNWWSRYHRYDEEEYMDLMQKFADKDIPLSVAVIDMDWHITEVEPQYLTGWTGYTWNQDLFPDPERFLVKLHDLGLKTTLNVHPAEGIRPFEVQYDNMCKRLGKNPADDEIIEFDFTDQDFVEAYFEEINHRYEEIGVDFWWIDWQQGTVSRMEGLDPLWALNHFYYLDSCKSEFIDNEAGERGLTFSRYAGLGSHRYPVGFSGDTVISWESLDFQPYFTATASNVGYTWWSHDVGGHFLGVKNDELTSRWVQYSVFSPIFRLHSSDNPFMSKEPWNYSEPFETIISESMRLRQRLIPYLYTMNYRTALENKAIVMPMYYVHPEKEAAYQVPNEYYFGSELIACPITSPIDPETQVAKFSVWLPEGEYFDIFNHRCYEGDKNINVYRNIYDIPVFAKAGAILPLDNAEKLENGTANPEDLLLKVFTGADGEFNLIEDNYELIDPSENDYACTEIKYAYNDGVNSVLSVDLSGDFAAIPANRNITVELVGVSDTDVYLNGELIKNTEYKADRQSLLVNLGQIGNEAFELVFTNSKIAEVSDESALEDVFNILNRMQIDNEMKRRIFNEYRRNGNSNKTLSNLYASNADQKVIDVLAELFYAGI